MSTFAKNIAFLTLSALIGFVLMWWLYRGFRGEQLLAFFTLRANYVWISLAVAAGVVANVLRSLRWRMLLAAAGLRITRRRAVELVFISYLVNSVTPRLGELVRCLLLKSGNASTTSRALGTVVSEKLSDVVCLLLLLAVALGLRWQPTTALMQSALEGAEARTLGDAYTLGMVLFLLAAVALCVVLWRRLKGLCLNLLEGIRSIVRLKRVRDYVGLCVGIWTCNFLQIFLLAPCFSELSAMCTADFVHLFALISIGALFPTPAGAGPWHFAAVKTLTAVYGVSRTAAQTFALVSHGLKTLLVMVLGVCGFAGYYRAVWRRMQKARKKVGTQSEKVGN